MDYKGAVLEPAKAGWNGLVSNAVFTHNGESELRIMISNLHACVGITPFVVKTNTPMGSWIVGSTEKSVVPAIELVLLAASLCADITAFETWFNSQDTPRDKTPEEFGNVCIEALQDIQTVLLEEVSESDLKNHATERLRVLYHAEPAIAGLLCLCDDTGHVTYNAMQFVKPFHV